MSHSPFEKLSTNVSRYGALSFKNHALVRSFAERLRGGFCQYLDASDGECVFLVPPEGGFHPEPHGGAAYSVSGTGFLPLGRISFGLAVRVSTSGDWLRVIFHCAREGDRLNVQIDGGKDFDLALPLEDKDVKGIFDPLYRFIYDWFDERITRFEHGDYGTHEMGFEIISVKPE